ncbi:MAG: hypothetical protein ACLRWQ_24000 [Flavonifractor plautii]
MQAGELTEAISKYSSVKVAPLEERIFHVSATWWRSPSLSEIFSNYAILGRLRASARHLRYSGKPEAGLRREIQLTDGLKELCKRDNRWWRWILGKPV